MTRSMTPAAALRVMPTSRPTRSLGFAPNFMPAAASLFHAWRP